MSAYYTQWCKTHGEWSMDIDNPGDCPKCIELGLTEIQQLRKKLADWVEHEDLAPHNGCRCNYCVVIRERDKLKEEVAYIKIWLRAG